MALTNAFLSGLLLLLSLIISVGAQNAFILQQGLRGQHLFSVAVICTVSDAVLMYLGVSGAGVLLADSPLLQNLLSALGILFLLTYAIQSFHQALTNTHQLQVKQGALKSRYQVWLMCLMFTWFNPLVLLDTIVIIGTSSASYTPTMAFYWGAVTGSAIFFFGLIYGAKALAPWLARANTWRFINGATGIIMTYAAFHLALNLP